MSNILRFFVSCIISLAVFQAAMAESAYEFASNFFQAKRTIQASKSGSSSKPKLTAIEIPGTNVQVFKRSNGGFVALDSVDGQWVVSAYSETGDINADNASQMEIIGKMLVNSDSLSLKRYSSIKKPGTPIKGPWITTQWNQDEPFNRFCPYDTLENKRTPVGCSTVAFAQLMYYYKVPNHTTFHRNEWDKMKLSYNDSYTEEEANAVALFMADIAQEACAVSFNAKGSTGNIPNFYTGYSKIDVDRYDGIAFCNETDAPQIVVTTGFPDSHAVIMDGIDSNGYWHLNWGWGGSWDGWYPPDKFEIIYGGVDVTHHAADYQVFPNPNPANYRPRLRMKDGIGVDKTYVKPGENLSVTFKNIEYLYTDKMNFSFKNACLSVSVGYYYPFKWRMAYSLSKDRNDGSTRVYRPGYVGRKYFPSATIDSKTLENENQTGRDIVYEFALPDIPCDTIIIRPEYYLSLTYYGHGNYDIGMIPVKRWPYERGEYTISSSDEWEPFVYSNANNAFVSGNLESMVPEVLLLSKQTDGSFKVEPLSLDALIMNLIGEGVSSLDNAVIDNENKREATGYYNLSGQYSDNPFDGFNIVRYSDGTAQKRIITNSLR